MKTTRNSIEPLESRIAPSVFLVTTTADITDAAHDTGSLRDAIALADAHAGADTIQFHFATPPPAHGAYSIQLSLGELLIDPATAGDKLTIKGLGAGKLIIDGNHASRVFEINDGVSGTDSPVSISGLSIINGNAGSDVGGGIICTESLTLKNVVLSGNTASFGGAVYTNGDHASGTKVTISQSLITGNTTANAAALNIAGVDSISLVSTVVSGNTDTGGGGGGIYASVNNQGTGITINGCQISGNTTGGYGAGLIVQDGNSAATSQITISKTTISGNTTTGTGAKGGGGLFIGSGHAVITGSTIENNTAVYNGGGISATGFASLTISKSTISGNQTTASNSRYQGGGGIFIQGFGSSSSTAQPVKIISSVITDNQSARYGGGIFAYNGQIGQNGLMLTVSGSKFSGNSVVSGGAGGGLATNEVKLNVTGSAFSSNSGSAIDLIFGSATISNSKLSGNLGARGGAMFAEDMTALTIKSVVATGNSASYSGGAEYLKNISSFTISGGSLTGNSAANGGGIYTYNAGGSIKGVTISGNTALTAGGGIFNGGSTPGAVTLQIAKVIANTAPTDPNVSGAFTLV